MRFLGFAIIATTVWVTVLIGLGIGQTRSSDSLQTQASQAGIMPAGSVMFNAGAGAVTGWLVADGSIVSSATYPALAARIGEVYGDGGDAGGPLFNLPDCSGRVIAGKEASATRLTVATSGIDGGVLGASGGDENAATHTHSVDPASTAVTGTSASDAHDHTTTGEVVTTTAVASGAGALGVSTNVAGIVASDAHDHGAGTYVVDIASTATTGAFTGTTENVQPTIVLTCLIKI